MSMQVTREEMAAIRRALVEMPKVCKYHGSELTRESMLGGERPCCDSGKTALFAQTAWRALMSACDRAQDSA